MLLPQWLKKIEFAKVVETGAIEFFCGSVRYHYLDNNSLIAFSRHGAKRLVWMESVAMKKGMIKKKIKCASQGILKENTNKVQKKQTI